MPPSSTIHPSSVSVSVSASASASASASSSATSSPSHDSQGAITGAVLGIVGLVLLAGIVFITLRVRRRRAGDGETVIGPFHGTALLDKDHPAAKIVPFGTPGTEAHLFRTFVFSFLQDARLSRVAGHTPGRDMRIAIRRPDGAWDFTDSSQPFTPTGVSDICPSPMSSTATLISSSQRHKGSTNTKTTVREYKEQESRASQMIRLGYDARDNELEMEDLPLAHPPPAYGQEPTVGPYVTYRPPNSRHLSQNISS